MVTQIENRNNIKTTTIIRYVFIILIKVKFVILNSRTNQVFLENSKYQMQFEMSTCSAIEEVLEVKTMLLKLKRVLEKVIIFNFV